MPTPVAKVPQGRQKQELERLELQTNPETVAGQEELEGREGLQCGKHRQTACGPEGLCISLTRWKAPLFCIQHFKI